MNDDHKEAERLAALRSYDVLDTPPEQALDDLAALAAHICAAPIAQISLVDEHRQWFKARVGSELTETPREISFCAHALQSRELMVVPDATQDERFARNPLVTAEPHIRFYAGAPLVTPEGAVLGTLCVIDRQPRALQPAQAEALRVLSEQVMTQFELRRRSRELQASEAKLRAILETQLEGVHLLDAAGVLQDTNAAGWRLLEVEGPGAVAGLNLVSLIVPEHRETMLTLLGEVARGESRTVENQFTGLRGSTRWLEWSAAPFYEAATGRNLVVAVTRDTTARHADEERQRKVARALQVSDAALHAISQGVLITGPDELTLASNQAFTKITGYSLEEIRGRNCRFLQGPLTDRATVQEIRRCLDRGAEFSGEILNYCKDGTPFWNELTISPVRDKEGQLTHYIGVTRDITPRKQAAEAQAFTSEMLERTGELARIGGWSVDLPTMKQTWTRETFRIAEIEPPIEPPIAEGINLFAPEARATMAAAVQAAMDTGTPYDLELPIITARGRHLWVRTQGFAEMRDGKTVRIYGTIQDVTARKETDDALRKRTAFLEAMINSPAHGILVVDPQMDRLYQNAKTVELWKIPRGIAENPDYSVQFEFVSSRVKDPQAFRARVAFMYANPKVTSHDEVELVDGTFLERSSAPVLGKDGELFGRIWTFREVTPRKQAEAALRDSVNRMHLATEATGVGIWEWNVLTDRIRWDTQMFRIYGIAPTDDGFVEYSDWSGSVLPEELRQQAEILQDTVRRLGHSAREFRILRRDDRECRHIQAVATVRTNDQGQAEWVVGTNLDITARKQAEQVLRESELRLRLALRGGDLGLWDWNPQTGELAVNARWLAMLGLDPEGPAPHIDVWHSLVHPDDRPKLDHLFQSVILNPDGRDLEVEIRARHADGNYIWILDKGTVAERDAEGRPLRVVGTHMDITERKRAEEVRLAGEAKFRAIIEVSPIPMALNDEEQRITYLNPVFLETFGYRREDIPTLAEWWPKAYPDPAYRQWVADSWHAELQRSKASGETFSPLEVEVRCKDGTSKTVLASTAAISEALAGEHLVLLYDITERKRAEQVLREREARLSFLLTHTPMSIYTSRASGDFGATFVSENIQALTGHPASEFVADSEFWLRHLHPDDTERVLSGIPRVFEQEQYEHEYWFRHADGTYRWLHDQVRVLRDELGQPTEMIGCLIDVTGAKRTALALAESEHRLRTLIETIPQQVWTARPDGALDYVSQRVAEYFGCPVEGLLEEAWTRFVHPDDLPQCFERWTRSLDTGEPYAVEFRLKRASDASYRWHLGRAVALRDEAGAIIKWLGTNTDISERREAEEKIRLSEERQELALAAAALGLWDWDVPSGRVLFDERWCEMLGYEVGELEPRLETWLSLLHPDDRPDAERALDRHLAGATAVYEAEFRLRHKSGQWAWILTRGKVVERDATGAAVRVTGTHMNLTERKQLEQQFLRSQRMESIGTLAGGIAHDLNNMLSPIMMSLAVLEMRFTDQASTDLLSIISDSARNGAEMVSQILSFARGVEGRRVEVQLRHLIRELEKLVNDTFLKNIQVRTLVPHDLWTVIGDPTQLHQVLLNLCVNARDAMPEGGTLTLSAENVRLDEHFAGLSLEANPGAYVLIEVADTGTGIPARVITQIFDPFFTTKEVGKGTGLGLSTSLTIIKSHGGFVRVESEPGRGSKFSIYLPAETEPGPEAAAEAKAELLRGQGELILVVDDEALVRRITEQTLQLFGYRVVLAADGSEAVAAYARQRDEIAAVITDLNMPGMDGFAAIPVIRHLNPLVPIIATTGLAVESQLSRVAHLGVEHFLRKPCTAEALLKALKDVLDTAKRQE